MSTTQPQIVNHNERFKMSIAIIVLSALLAVGLPRLRQPQTHRRQTVIADARPICASGPVRRATAMAKPPGRPNPAPVQAPATSSAPTKRPQLRPDAQLVAHLQ